MLRTQRTGCLGGYREVAQRFVPAGVEGPQGERASAEGLCEVAVDRFLLVDVRRGIAVGEEELRAHQAGEVRSAGVGQMCLRHGADAGADEDVHAIAGARRGSGLLLGGPSDLGVLGGPAPEPCQDALIRVEHELPGGAVERDEGALGRVEHRRSHPPRPRAHRGPGPRSRCARSRCRR